jgi:hypothetical protein
LKKPRAENYGIEAFTKNGLKTSKDGPSVLTHHVGKHDSSHNKARQHYIWLSKIRGKIFHM